MCRLPRTCMWPSCPTALKSSAPHTQDTRSPCGHSISVGLGEARDGVSCVGWSSALLSLRPLRSVCPSFWPFSLRLSPLLSAPFPLGSTSCVFQPDLLSG